MSPRRQVVACVQQAETWSGTDDAASRPFFTGLVERFDAAGIASPALRANLAQRAERATAAYAAFARYLADEYSPHADAPDAVGPERYALFSRSFNGIDLDLAETYAWGWDELYRIEHAMREVGERILPGAPLTDVIAHLEADPNRVVEGVDAFQAWLQDLMDRTIAELDGTHFDIPEPVKRVEAMIAPPGGAAAMYYTGPSEDFSRPGRTWYPTLGKTRFPLWGEVSICYHEGVPGHHLQIAQVRYLADRLSRYQRTLAGSSGHAEGWALYAERLMGELGYLDDPAYELGMLRAQAMRAVRVVVDIGMHLELPIPERERYHGGETWTPELALPFVIERSWFPEDFMRSEVDRYLGMPAQAISYKVGERVWLGARDAAKAHAGAAFDLKEFHRHALDLGPDGPRPARTRARADLTDRSPMRLPHHRGRIAPTPCQGARGRLVQVPSGRRNQPPAARLPPSAWMVVPVTNAERSDARNRAQPATSAAVPNRPDRHPVRDQVLLLLGHPPAVGHLERLREVGRDRVHPHPVVAELEREAPREAGDRGLERRVHRTRRDAAERLHRRDVDDAPPRRLTMAGANTWVQRNTWWRFTRYSASHSASSLSRNAPRPPR